MRKKILGIMPVILLLPGAAWAKDLDTVAELKKELEQQRQQTELLLQRINELDLKLREQEKSRAESTDVAPASPAALTESVPAAEADAAPGKVQPNKASSWVDRFNLEGDLRYRHETISPEGLSTRNRQRIRARVGLETRVSEIFDVGIMVVSGSDDPISTNQTLDGAFSTKDIRLDLAYFDWHPVTVPGFHLSAGKIKNPFFSPGKTELIWDSDLRPEGGAIKYSKNLSNLELFANLGGFWAEERSTAADTGLFGAQAGAKYSFPFLNDKGYVLAGGSYFDYANTKGMLPLYEAVDPFGNTVDGNGRYMYGYELVEYFAEFGFKVHGIPVSFLGDYVKNRSAGAVKNQGWLAGTVIGKCSSPNSWSIRYNYRDLEADAVLGVFADSDFIDGGTDGRGHEFGLDYQIVKGVKTGATYFDNQRRLSLGARDYQRLQLDLVFDF